jgi:hypothetical protein
MIIHRTRAAVIFMAIIVLAGMVSAPALAGDGEKGKLAVIAKELKAAVAAGEMTEAQAKEKWFAVQTKVYLARMAKKLKAAVAAGKITEVQAKAKWKAILKKVAAKKATMRTEKAAGREK